MAVTLPDSPLIELLGFWCSSELSSWYFSFLVYQRPLLASLSFAVCGRSRSSQIWTGCWLHISRLPKYYYDVDVRGHNDVQRLAVTSVWFPGWSANLRFRLIKLQAYFLVSAIRSEAIFPLHCSVWADPAASCIWFWFWCVDVFFYVYSCECAKL